MGSDEMRKRLDAARAARAVYDAAACAVYDAAARGDVESDQ